MRCRFESWQGVAPFFNHVLLHEHKVAGVLGDAMATMDVDAVKELVSAS